MFFTKNVIFKSSVYTCHLTNKTVIAQASNLHEGLKLVHNSLSLWLKHIHYL